MTNRSHSRNHLAQYWHWIKSSNWWHNSRLRYRFDLLQSLRFRVRFYVWIFRTVNRNAVQPIHTFSSCLAKRSLIWPRWHRWHHITLFLFAIAFATNHWTSHLIHAEKKKKNKRRAKKSERKYKKKETDVKTRETVDGIKEKPENNIRNDTIQ